MQDDPLAAAKRSLQRTDELSSAARSATKPARASDIGTPKPKRPKRTQDIRLYAPGERDQPKNLRENLQMKQRLISKRAGKRGASRRA